MDAEVTRTRLIGSISLAMLSTATVGPALMSIANFLPNGLPRAIVWWGGVAVGLLIGPLVIHRLYGRRKEITALYIASLLVYTAGAFAFLLRLAFYLAWRRGNLEL
jgi:hypothetical protein